MPPNAKGVGLAKLWSGKQTKHHRGQSQRQHSKTFTIDSDDEMKMIIKEATTIQTTTEEGTTTTRREKDKISRRSLRNQPNVARAYQHKKKKKFYSSYTSQHEFPICRFLLVLIAIALRPSSSSNASHRKTYIFTELYKTEEIKRK